MSTSLIGIGCLLFFAASQGVRDAFFGNVFQSVSFLLIAVLAFGVSSLVFTVFSFVRRPGDMRRLCAAPVAFAALNVTNATAWLSFFFGLRFLEPAVVALLFNGVGSLVVLAIAGLGWSPTQTRLSTLERICYLGVAVTLVATVMVVLGGRAEHSLAPLATQAIALVMVAFGGAMITISHMIARWFNDQGVNSDAVMGTRFLLTVFAAGVLEFGVSDGGMRPSVVDLVPLTFIAVGLIVVPTFVLQLGVARTTPMAVNVFRALGPVFVFAVQQFDGRLLFSGATLACIIGFCLFSIGASLFRGWDEAKNGIGSVSTAA